MSFEAWRQPLDHPLRTLCSVFATWKALLLFVAVASPGSGYDTSTFLSTLTRDEGGASSSVLSRLSEKLTRWDGIYFVSIANRGYRYEQEWAFGYGFTRLVGLIKIGKFRPDLKIQRSKFITRPSEHWNHELQRP